MHQYYKFSEGFLFPLLRIKLFFVLEDSKGVNNKVLHPTRYSGSIAEYYYLNVFQVKEWTSGLRKEGYKIDRQINGKERILKELLSSIGYD